MSTVGKEVEALFAKKRPRFIYLDHAASTPLCNEALEAMLPYLQDDFGNPGAFYALGQKAKDAVDDSRERIAKLLHAQAREIIFTGSGTESNNMAIFGLARMYQDQGKHILISAIEHHAVEGPAMQLKKEGFEVEIVPVKKNGILDMEAFQNMLRPDTILVSVMYANNEIGTLQPIQEIGELLKNHPAKFHTDACQASGALSLNVQELGVDALTLNGSKCYGPKGVGALYLKHGVRLKPVIYGGGQERNLRGGTENVAGIVGFATALELAEAKREEESARLSKLRDALIQGLMQKIPKVILNGDAQKRLPNNVNVSILDIEGEAFTLFLNELEIYASTGSACTSTSLDPSHVILATGLPYECAHGSIRFTLGRSTTQEDIDYLLETIPEIVRILRKISPLNLDLEDTQGGKGELHYL